jgi:glycosyltransferase involved in cell wall biosynthesis
LLVALLEQRTENRFTFSIVIADNDDAHSARPMAEEFASKPGLEVIYCSEIERNIAKVRNKALENSRGDFVAFIDDDEFPVKEWLGNLLETCEKHQAAGVLGPVRPHFEEPPPEWIVRGGFCERPEYPTGKIINWNEARTGNVLLRRSIFQSDSLPFDPKFYNGGEDVDFFLRKTRQGHVFRWCNEAPAYETVPANRLKRSYMLRRAFLRGKNGLKLPKGRLRSLVKSFIAVPIYTLALPPMLLMGQHWFMKYCIKLCDHLGKLLAFARINPVSER